MTPDRGARWRRWLLRLIGVGLLAFLFWRLDLTRIVATLRGVEIGLVLLAVALNFPMLAFKVQRWRGLLRAADIHYAFVPAALSYCGTIFLGLVTPGKIGEFAKALHVSRDCDVPAKVVFPSVLADRLFDLYALMATCAIGLPFVIAPANLWLIVGASVLIISLPLGLFLHPGSFQWGLRTLTRFGTIGRKLAAQDGWLDQLHVGLRRVPLPALLLAGTLTLCAYLLYYGQTYLIARALQIDISFVVVACATAVGSLVALLPFAISGIGTREAAIVAFFLSVGIPGESALTFSLLIFAVFNIFAIIIGVIAWWLKPIEGFRQQVYVANESVTTTQDHGIEKHV